MECVIYEGKDKTKNALCYYSVYANCIYTWVSTSNFLN